MKSIIRRSDLTAALDHGGLCHSNRCSALKTRIFGYPVQTNAGKGVAATILT